MKILVFSGTARKNGATRNLIAMFLEQTNSLYSKKTLTQPIDVEIIDCYHICIQPCIDCRYCWKNKGCAIQDDMQKIYQKIADADAFIMATPMYFHTVPGMMKIVIDRFQTYWAGMALRKDHPNKENYKKKGVILLAGGAEAFENQFQSGEKVLKDCLNCFAAIHVGSLFAANTDHIDPRVDKNIAVKMQHLAERFLTI